MRIIPLTILALVFALVFRLENLVSGALEVASGQTPELAVAQAIAEETDGEETSADDEVTSADEASTPAPAEIDESPAMDAMNTSNCSFSQIEIDLLQSLSKRREALEEREKELRLKDNILRATEMKIDEKIDEMRELKKTLDDLLSLYNDKEQQKIRSLVKVYENMKPKDAARIFEEMDMDILLQVIDKMSERKIAPILANLTPTRAQAVTAELANQRKLPDIGLDEDMPPPTLN